MAWTSGLSSAPSRGASSASARRMAETRAVTERLAVMARTSFGLGPARRCRQHGEPFLRLELLLHLDLADEERGRRGRHGNGAALGPAHAVERLALAAGREDAPEGRERRADQVDAAHQLHRPI